MDEFSEEKKIQEFATGPKESKKKPVAKKKKKKV